MQRSFDDLGAPLHEVTFCVIDLETTGGSPRSCAITEIGAVKYRGGECLGAFQTLVNPGCAIPPEIVVLTGITEAMVLPAPEIDEVLPSLLEFIGDAVIVGHNVRFDLRFLSAALDGAERPRLSNRWVDTVALARRLVRDEVPNCKLGTLAAHLGLPRRPSHRALDDALATADLLHLLLERAGTLGVLGLDDLLALPTMGGHAQAQKLKLTTSLPRAPGVYLFRDRAGRVLYVGKAANIRQRVRSYFSTDERRKVGALLREVAAIDHEVCTHPVQAAVRELRLIASLQPRYNRVGKGVRPAWVRLTLDERYPRLALARSPKAGRCLEVGPLPSAAMARLVIEAIETVAPLRRCSRRVGTALRDAPCTAAQLGVATCPCTGNVDEAAYAEIVATVVHGLTIDPTILLDPLDARMARLAAAERFEEAAAVRERAAALATTLRRGRQVAALRAAGRLVVELAGGGGVRIDDGRLVDTWSAGTQPSLLDAVTDRAAAPTPTPATDGVLAAAEAQLLAAWIESDAHRLRVLHCSGDLATPLPRLPSYQPGKPLARSA